MAHSRAQYYRRLKSVSQPTPVLPPPKEGKFYKNNLARQVFQKIVVSRTPDVHFIFNGNGDDKATKIAAHKDVLAAVSPVFDVMFNGELKEKGDVKIVDASAAAFKEFLQFFYNDQVKMSMENIEDLLNLAHKYDVTGCFQMGVAFLKENLATEKLFWGLQIAHKFDSDDLKAFCKTKIVNNPKALDAINTDDCDTPAKKQGLISTSSQFMLIEAFSIAKEVISKQSAELERFRPKDIPFSGFT